eukprot:780156-Pelagomonas_calceolata.AAC.2
MPMPPMSHQYTKCKFLDALYASAHYVPSFCQVQDFDWSSPCFETLPYRHTGRCLCAWDPSAPNASWLLVGALLWCQGPTMQPQ